MRATSSPLSFSPRAEQTDQLSDLLDLLEAINHS